MRTDGTSAVDHYLKPILEHKNLIVGVTAVVALLAVAASIILPASYRSTASVLLTPISGNPLAPLESDTDVDMATELLISTSKAVVGRVADDLVAQSVDISIDDLSDNVSAASPRDSKVLDLTYRAATPELAQLIANSFAVNYLDYREQIATENQADAVEDLNDRVASLKEQLSEIEGRLSQAEEGTRTFVSLSVERDSVDGELRAQQEALAALSTLSPSAGEVLNVAPLPLGPSGPGIVSLVIGGLAAGLIFGVVLAMLISAVHASRAPRNRRASDHIEHNRRQEDRFQVGGRRASDHLTESAVEKLARVTAGRADEETTDDETTDDELTDDESTDNETSLDVHGEAEAPDAEVDDEVASHFGDGVPPPPRNKAKVNGHATPDTHTSHEFIGPSNLEAEADLDRLVAEIERQLPLGPLTCLAVGQDNREQSVAAGFTLLDGLKNHDVDVLIIDTMFDEPMLAAVLDLPNGSGLSELLVEQTAIESAVQQLAGFDRLFALTAGTPSASAQSALGSPRFDDLLHQIRRRFPVTVILAGDLSDAAVMSRTDSELDGLIVATSTPAGQAADPSLVDKVAQLGVAVRAWVSVDDDTKTTSPTTTATTTV